MSRPRDRHLLVLLLTAAVACGDPSAPTRALEPRQIPAPAVDAAKASATTLYALSFQDDLLTGSTVFSALGKTGDPFAGIGGENVRILIPATTSGDPAVCDTKEASLGATTNGWGGYAGEWTGTLGTGRRSGRAHVSYQATRAGGGYLNLDIWDIDVDASGLVLRMVNARGLVGATSRPDASSPYDGTDRCLSFSIIATP